MFQKRLISNARQTLASSWSKELANINLSELIIPRALANLGSQTLDRLESKSGQAMLIGLLREMQDSTEMHIIVFIILSLFYFLYFILFVFYS